MGRLNARSGGHEVRFLRCIGIGTGGFVFSERRVGSPFGVMIHRAIDACARFARGSLYIRKMGRGWVSVESRGDGGLPRDRGLSSENQSSRRLNLGENFHQLFSRLRCDFFTACERWSVLLI